jgi:NTP pyrophosphatase (non-canonical NTP hydrolase)|nr:MAG: nucleotide pyrophosphohydrolase [Actinomycetota bacterium]
MSIRDLQEALARFAAERDWEQYHTPKNLVMALAGEVGELLDIFQWLTPDESRAVMADPELREAVLMEMGDVFQYLLRLADVLEIDIEQATWDVIRRNERRFPAND